MKQTLRQSPTSSCHWFPRDNLNKVTAIVWYCMAKIADFWTHIFHPPPMKNFLSWQYIFFYLQESFWQEAITVVESVWQLVCLVRQLEAVYFLWPFWYWKLHKIRDVFINKHNIIDSFFNDIFRPFGVGKSLKSHYEKLCVSILGLKKCNCK